MVTRQLRIGAHGDYPTVMTFNLCNGSHPVPQYIAIQASTGEVFVCTRRAARNMSFQNFTAENGKVDILLELSGQVGWGRGKWTLVACVLVDGLWCVAGLGHYGTSPQGTLDFI